MVVGTCWYLSGLSLFASLLASAMTVAPGHERWTFDVFVDGVGIAIIFAALALIFRMQQFDKFRNAQLTKKLFFGIAILATLSSLFLVVG